MNFFVVFLVFFFRYEQFSVCFLFFSKLDELHLSN